MFPLVRGCVRLKSGNINEEITPGYVQLFSVFEGPLGATERLAFAVELLIDNQDFESAKLLLDAGEDAAPLEDQFDNVEHLMQAIDLPEDASPAELEYKLELLERIRKFGLYDVVRVVTRDSFKDLLKFLRHDEKVDIKKIPSPKYWSTIEPGGYIKTAARGRP